MNDFLNKDTTSGGFKAPSGEHNPTDLDASPQSYHHTLGTGTHQAARGDHTHADLGGGVEFPVGGDATKYLRGDGPSWQVLNKAAVGLANVDNTSDVNKPVSTAQAASIATKEPAFAAGTTSQYRRGDKTWQTLDKAAVGLANVDNTSDANKPVSTAQAASIATKEPAIANPGDTTKYWRGDKTFQILNKAAVGLANVDNTSDVNKPVSTAQAASIATKEPTISAGTAAQYYRGDKTWQTLNKAAVGLGNVDNTSDINKPVSTAQQAAIDAAVASASGDLPVGSVIMWYGSKTSPPTDWLIMDGTSFSAATYPDLNTLLGSSFVPNMADRFPRGAPAAGVAGSVGGSDASPLPNHTHSIPAATVATDYKTANTGSFSALRQASFNNHDHGGATGNPGTNPNIDTVPVYRTMWFIIKAR